VCRSEPGPPAAQNTHAIADTIAIVAETAASSRARSKACAFACAMLSASRFGSEDNQKPARQDVAEKPAEIEDAAMQGKEERTAHNTYCSRGSVAWAG